MSERIFTLFGEEIVPEQIKAVSKSRGKKTKEIVEEATEEITAEIEEQPVVAELPAAEEEFIATTEVVEIAEPLEIPEIEENQETQEPEQVIETEVVAEKPVATTKEPKEPKEPKALKNLPADWEGEKQYYSIGEVAALFSVRTSHIRFWTNEFKLKVRTTRKGDRLYTPEQIKEIRAIHHLVKERGFTLTGAKAKLKAQNKMDVETVDLKQSLQTLRNKLIIIKNQLVA